MPYPVGSHTFYAKRHGQGLMAKADAKERDTPAEMPDCLNRHTRFHWCAGSWRNVDTAGVERLNLVDRNLIVTKYLNILTQFPKVLHEVIGEGIIVVDHQ